MNRNTEKLARRAAEMEEALAGLTAMFALLPLPGEGEKGRGSMGLARQLGKRTQITEGLRAVDGVIAGTSLERDKAPRHGSDMAVRGGRTEQAAAAGGTSDPGLYRQTRALRRLSEQILRT